MRSCVSCNGEKVVSRLTDDVVARGRRLRLALEFLRSCEECSASPTTERAALAAVLPHIMHMCGPDLLRANTDLRDLLVRAKDHHKVRRAGRQYLFDCGVVIRELARRLDEGLGFVGTGNKGASGRGGAGQAAGEPGARP